MIPKKREKQGMSSRMFLRGNDHRDAIYCVYNEYGPTQDYAFVNGMYFEGTVDTILPDLDIDIPDIDLPDIDMPELPDMLDIPGVDTPEIETPDIEIPDIEIPEIDIPEIDMPIQNTPNDDPMETGFVWKKYPSLAALCFNGLTSDSSTGYYNNALNNAIIDMDRKCIFVMQNPDANLSLASLGACRNSEYAVIKYGYNQIAISKDGYEWRRKTLTKPTNAEFGTYQFFAVYPMGESRFCYISFNSSSLHVIYCHLLDTEHGDFDVVENEAHYSFMATMDDINVVGSSYSGSLVMAEHNSHDKMTLYEVRPSGMYEKHIFEINFKSTYRAAQIMSNGEIRCSLQKTEIVKCGDYYIFATHQIQPIGNYQSNRPWGVIGVYKSTDLSNWTYEELCNDYVSRSYTAPVIQIASRNDVCYIYTYVQDIDSTYTWEAKGYYATRGQHWNSIPFGSTCSCKSYQCANDEVYENFKIGLNSVSAQSAALSYADIFKFNYYRNRRIGLIYGKSSAYGPAYTLNGDYMNIFWEYGKLTDNVDYIGLAAYRYAIYINPMFQDSDDNFVLYKPNNVDTYDIQKVTNKDYCG